MLIMAIKKKGRETEEDIKKYAKKCGYKIYDTSDDGKYISYYMRKNKVGQPSKKVPTEKILEMRKTGKTVKVIAQELGVSVASVYNYLKEDKNEK